MEFWLTRNRYFIIFTKKHENNLCVENFYVEINRNGIVVADDNENGRKKWEGTWNVWPIF